MTLHEWADQHRDDLRQETPRAAAIRALLQVADRELRDAESVWSDDGRLEHAFAACLAVAALALAASGYRVRQGASAHHYLLVESLHHTLKLTPAEVKELQDYRKKRSRSMYEQVEVVTKTEADAALTAAQQLRDRSAMWLAQEHPDLSGG